MSKRETEKAQQWRKIREQLDEEGRTEMRGHPAKEQSHNNHNNNNKDCRKLTYFFSKANVSQSRAAGINLLKNKCRARRQAVIKVLTDQSASDSEPAIILTESNEHSKPRSAPNMKGGVIGWQLASRRGNQGRGMGSGVDGEGEEEMKKRGQGETADRLGCPTYTVQIHTHWHRHARTAKAPRGPGIPKAPSSDGITPFPFLRNPRGLPTS